MKYLFTVGMFRSGTTFLGRVLDAHPRMVVASDPYFEFFKAFRNEMYHRSYPQWDDTEPLGDYFCFENPKLLEAIQTSTFDQPLKNQSLETILSRITEHGGLCASLVMPHIQDIKAENYRELWIELAKRLEKVYAKADNAIIGCKETWPEEMITPFIRTFPESKSIHIIRDPRAVISSNFSKDGSVIKYPLLFLIRQWRKSVAFHLLNRDKKSNYLLVQYESLVNNTEDSLRKMCEFVGVEFAPEMLQTENYKDSKGKAWSQNSSYGTSSKVNKAFTEKWKTALTPAQIQYIEDLCQPEMEYLGYSRITEPAPFKSVFSNQDIAENEIADWMKVFHQRYQTSPTNIAQEHLRQSILRDPESYLKELTENERRSIFIDPDFLTKLTPVGSDK